MSEQRADPEELLEAINAEEEKAGRGKLKIFFGDAAMYTSNTPQA